MDHSYQVRKIAPHRWMVSSIAAGWITPCGTYKSKQAAITAARLLAGWRCKVEVVK